jgi:hypothetical protein
VNARRAAAASRDARTACKYRSVVLRVRVAEQVFDRDGIEHAGEEGAGGVP